MGAQPCAPSMEVNGNGNAKHSAADAEKEPVPPQLAEHAFSSENQPANKPRRKTNPLSDCLNDWLKGSITRSGKPPASILSKYNPAVVDIVQTLVEFAGGTFTGKFEDVSPRQALASVTAAQREIWQRMAGRPGLQLDLDAMDGVMESIETRDRTANVPLPLTRAERGEGG